MPGIDRKRREHRIDLLLEIIVEPIMQQLSERYGRLLEGLMVTACMLLLAIIAGFAKEVVVSVTAIDEIVTVTAMQFIVVGFAIVQKIVDIEV